MNKQKDRLKHKVVYVVTYLIFMAITICLGMDTDVWDDKQFSNQ